MLETGKINFQITRIQCRQAPLDGEPDHWAIVPGSCESIFTTVVCCIVFGFILEAISSIPVSASALNDEQEQIEFKIATRQCDDKFIAGLRWIAG